MNRTLNKGGLVAVALTSALMTGGAAAATYKIPRLADGSPDLQGTWTNATATPMERDPKLGDRRAYTEEEAAAIRKAALARVAADAAPTDPNVKQEAGALPPVGNYNLFWTERGMSTAQIGGEYRTSIIIDPPNGRIPTITKQARERRLANRVKTVGVADGPEQRSLGERCILSFGSSAGPPMLPTMYNSNYQIVQSHDTFMIQAEMVHDARIVRIGGKHVPSNVRKWMGDSIGHWDGDTLVVETTNFRPDQSFRGSSENMKVTERFTRVADNKIVYRFTVEDLSTFGEPFTGELAFVSYPDNLYEYACHEGNYGLPGILMGAREEEKVGGPRKAPTRSADSEESEP